MNTLSDSPSSEITPESVYFIRRNFMKAGLPTASAMKDMGFAKLKSVLLVNGLLPGTLLLWDAYHGHIGANPVNYALRTTGLSR